MTAATERVGRYQLLEPIGLGPTGTVSRAKVFGVAGFERQFAIKRFHAELTSSGAMAQALSSAARAYGGLEHPRIARMSEFGIAQGTTYTAVEYVPGLDAMRLISEVRLSSTTLAAGGALALVSQAARAIGYAHGRGLTHLGLSPTNVVVTPEGDVKITDFGILAATLPQRPTEVPRLIHRIGYLAPEQLSNEATSAATDVFALGVLAYELLTSQRTFKGETAAQLAKAVMGGPPSEPPLPRPIVRVLARCLARSPFERFPDARALADALDAALRVAPVPGTRKDIGSQVKQIVDRLADLHSGELSGMLSLAGSPNLGGPVAQIAALGAASRDSQDVEIVTMEFVRPDTPVAGPAKLVGPASRPTRSPADKPIDDGGERGAPPTLLPRAKTPPPVRELGSKIPVPPHTVPGLAPPPIPLPKGFAPPSLPAIPPNAPPAPGTLLGVGNRPMIPKPLVGAVPPPRPGQGPTRPVAVQLDPPDRPSESPVSPLKMMSLTPSGSAPSVPITNISRVHPIPPKLDAKKQVFGALRPDTDQPGAARTDLVIETDPGENSGLDALLQSPIEDDALSLPEPSLSVEMTIVRPSEEELTLPGGESRDDIETDAMSPILVEKLSDASTKPLTEIAPLVEDAWRAEALNEFPDEQHATNATPVSQHTKTLAGFTPSSSVRQVMKPQTASFSQQAERNVETMDVRALPKRGRKAPWIIVIVLGVLALGAGVFVGYDLLRDDEGGGVAGADAAAPSADARKVAVADGGPMIVGIDGKAEAIDAGVVATVDAATPDTPGSSDTLTITSAPTGARVYVNGSDKGRAPVKLPGTPDKFNIAVYLAGHELYLAAIPGAGTHAVKLEEITPPGGPAGIKVVHCKNKEQYYVYVDGKPTGMACPTERIQVQLGNHTVEVYDMVSEAKRSFPVSVKDTRLSVRVKVE